MNRKIAVLLGLFISLCSFSYGLTQPSILQIADRQWVDSRDQLTFEAALASAAAKSLPLYIGANYTFTSTQTIPINVPLIMTGGYKLTANAGVTVYILGEIIAPRVEIFSRTGHFCFGGETFPEWFGFVMGDSSSAQKAINLEAMRKACLSYYEDYLPHVTSVRNRSVSVAPGVAYMPTTDTVPVRCGMHIKGSGRGTIFYAGGDINSSFTFTLGTGFPPASTTVTTTPYDRDFLGKGYSSDISNMSFEGCNAIANRAAGFNIHNCWFVSCSYAMLISGGDGTISDIEIETAAYGYGIFFQDARSITVTNVNSFLVGELFHFVGMNGDINISGCNSHIAVRAGVVFDTASINRASFTGCNFSINAGTSGASTTVTFIGHISNVSATTYANFTGCNFFNSIGYDYAATNGVDHHVEFNGCVFDGKPPFPGAWQDNSASSLAIQTQYEDVFIKGCTFRNKAAPFIRIGENLTGFYAPKVTIMGSIFTDNTATCPISFYDLDSGTGTVYLNLNGITGEGYAPLATTTWGGYTSIATASLLDCGGF